MTSWPISHDDQPDTAADFHTGSGGANPGGFDADGGRDLPAGWGSLFNALQVQIGYAADTSTETTIFGRLLEQEEHHYKTETMGAVPAFADRVATYPANVTTDHHYDLSVASGRLRFTATTSTTDANFRCLYGHIPSGTLGDSEVRSTIYATNVDWDGLAFYQPGHVHRMTTERVVLDTGLATSGGSTTITDSGKSWSTSPREWAGLKQGARQVYVKLVNGTGAEYGNIRRVVTNTATQLTVDSAWTGANPSTDTYYEVFAYATRAVVMTVGPIAFGIHAGLQPTVFDNGTYSAGLLGAGADLTGYLGTTPSETALPWKMKSKLVGNTLSAVMWAAADAEPAYGAVGKSGSWSLASHFGDTPGMSGLYVGHLNYASSTAKWVEFDDLTITEL